MKHEKIGASAPKNADPGLLGGSPVHVAENGSQVHLKAALTAAISSGVTVLKDRQFGYLLGDPQVIVERRKGSAFVSVRPRPWNYSNIDREFLNPDSPGVERYALKLLARIHEDGRKEHDRRQRLVDLRKEERKVRT